MEQNITKQIETHSIELNLDEIFKEPLPEISSVRISFIRILYADI